MPGGLNDLRMGVCSMEFSCETCGESRDCQGHFGHIKLEAPVFNLGFLELTAKVLRCICHNCGKVKVVQNDVQKEQFERAVRINRPLKRLAEIAHVLAPIKTCVPKQEGDGGGCGAETPTKISTKKYRIFIEKEEKDVKEVHYYTARFVKNLFEKMDSADLKLLGFTLSHPSEFIVELLAVIPPQVRPTVDMGPDRKAEDGLTSAYRQVVKVNNELKADLEGFDREEKILELERLIGSIMVDIDPLAVSPTNEKKKDHSKTKLKIKSIEERLQAKDGRFRQHLMGKRVDFSARSVISPDPNIDLDELGVPEKIANSLTIPEEVTEFNYDRIVRLCLEGKVKFIIRPTQDRPTFEDFIVMSKVGKSEEEVKKFLSYGTVVERVLEDGDYVLFNRQPTLHRMSMMAHRVRVLPGNTFRLNLSVCTPYNADFDGDEMNMHVPQSIETIAELKHIAHVPKQIVAPKNNAPVMGIVQDALLGVYLMTARDVFLTAPEMMNLLMWYEPKVKFEEGDLPIPAILMPEPLWTGKQLISMLIPPEITLTKGNFKDNQMNLNDKSGLVIHDGEIMTGLLQKEVVGTGYGGLVHSIWLELGSQPTCDFINNVQKVVNNWLIERGFSVGIADVVPDEALKV